MQHAVRVDDIESVVRKAQLLGIFLLKRARQAQQLEVLPSRLQGGFGEIDASVHRAVESEHHAVGSVAGTDLEELLAFGLGEGDEQGDVPFSAVAVFAKFFEEILCIGAGLDEMRAAGFGVPKRMHVAD